MKVCVIASGSKGNMTYVESGNTKILIDAGISLINASKRVNSINFNEITDVLIIHEHIDHIGFLASVLKKTNANLYISKKCFMSLRKDLVDKIKYFPIRFIEGMSRYIIGDFEVLTLPLSHDAKEVFGYILKSNEKSVGYITDTGIFPVKFKELLGELDCLIIEANHNVEMLVNSNREVYLINRILSANGHLSNQACYELLNEVLTDKNKYVVLSHVSEDCNCDECLYDEIINKLYIKYKGEILIARQHEAIKIIDL